MSIGAALSESGRSRDDLLHDANVAMYRAKERGRGGQFALFDVDRMEVRSQALLNLDTAFTAFNTGEVEVHYQPLVSLADRRIVGAETLVRWNHPDHGVLLPAQFIQLAEDNGTILPIGHLVLEQACRQAKTWHQEFGVTLQVGVNLSARQFQQASLVDEVAAALGHRHGAFAALPRDHGEPGHGDHVELTSTILTRLQHPRCPGGDRRLRDWALLDRVPARFPIDVVKIDQSFVRGVEQDPVKSAIVSAVVALSQAIGSTTVVEGVETAAQLEEILGLGCDVAQGHLLLPTVDGRCVAASC